MSKQLLKVLDQLIEFLDLTLFQVVYGTQFLDYFVFFDHAQLVIWIRQLEFALVLV